MQQSLDRLFAEFLRKQRGDLPYAAFARKLGITASSLFRLENCQQSTTLKTLQQICKRLKVKPQDIFSKY
jgi:DNA-binding Xre family transcriptional regulator